MAIKWRQNDDKIEIKWRQNGDKHGNNMAKKDEKKDEKEMIKW